MIKRISLAFLGSMLMIAFALYLLGMRKVELGQPFLSFLKSCAIELNDIKFEIPDIPQVPKLDNQLGYFTSVINVLINFLNGFVAFLNFFVMVINEFIKVLTFLFIVLKNLGTFINNVEKWERPEFGTNLFY